MVGSVAWPHLNLASKRQSENGVAERRAARVNELQAESHARTAVGGQHAHQFPLCDEWLNYQLRNTQASDTSLRQHSHVVDREPAVDRHSLTTAWALQTPRVALTSVVREAAANSGKRHRCHVEGRSTSRLER
jgi:hypothetical protein